jgi:protein-S-isoprenylcysteine O-methyltransferase Ste14
MVRGLDREEGTPGRADKRADPYSIVKHPLCTSVAVLVLRWIGYIFDTWLGAVIGIILYIGSRMFAPAEEAELSRTFDATWDGYCTAVRMPWV